jgi:hypothetical protein
VSRWLLVSSVRPRKKIRGDREETRR